MAKTGRASAQGKKTPTRKDDLIRLLKAKGGADGATLGTALGWQPHTVRAAITGLRKAGHVVVASRPVGGGASRYQLMSGAAKAEAEMQQSNAIEDPEATQTAEPAEPADAR